MKLLSPKHRRFVEAMTHRARLKLKEQGALGQCALLLQRDDRMVIVPLDFDTDESKKRSFAKVRALCRMFDAVLCLIIAEGWVVNLPPGTKPPRNMPRPSEHPDRVEEAVFSVEAPGVRYLGTAPLDRSGQWPTFGELTWGQDSMGSMVGMIPNSDRGSRQ